MLCAIIVAAQLSTNASSDVWNDFEKSRKEELLLH